MKVAPSSANCVLVANRFRPVSRGASQSSIETLARATKHTPLRDSQPPILMIRPYGFGSKVVRSQTLSMNKLSVSAVVYAELPSEALALLSIFAQAAAARYVTQPCKQSELAPLLETIWNRNRLCLSDLANPFRMTALLETELSSVCLAGGVQ
jgi:type III secretory pathway component EscT